MGETSYGGSPPDVVYITRPSRNDSADLRYSLRTLKHVPHGRVWISGHLPKWVTNVGRLPGSNSLPTKQLNQVENIRRAVDSDVADEFVYMNDDFFILHPVSEIPAMHKGPIDPKLHKVGLDGKTAGQYALGLAETVRLLAGWGFRDLLNYELHMPLTMSKPVLAEALERQRETADVPGLQFRTLYGNYHRIGGVQVADVKRSRLTDLIDGEVFVSTSDAAFQAGEIGRQLRARFSQPSPYER